LCRRLLQAGKLEKTIKSEEPPANNDGPVTILTAKTFDDIVYGKQRNVLIEFYGEERLQHHVSGFTLLLLPCPPGSCLRGWRAAG